MTSGRRAKAKRQAPRRGHTSKSRSAWFARVGARTWWGIAAAAVVAAFVLVVWLPSTGGGNAPLPKLTSLASLGHLASPGSPGSPGPEQVAVPHAAPIAGLTSAAGGQTVDGIQCNTTEQVLFHVHTHLTIFVKGVARLIPYGIGITPPRRSQPTAGGVFITGGSCFYWLHTHAADGIIHIESPVQRTYTLGEFFDIWGQPLTADRVGPAIGKVTVLYDGKLYHGNPRDAPLGNHVQIQLDVGTPLVAPEIITFPSTL